GGRRIRRASTSLGFVGAFRLNATVPPAAPRPEQRGPGRPGASRVGRSGTNAPLVCGRRTWVDRAGSGATGTRGGARGLCPARAGGSRRRSAHAAAGGG